MEETEKIKIAGQDWHLEILKETEESMLIQIVNNDFRSTALNEEKKKKIKEDVKDLGKWRKFKELKKDLGN